MDIDIERYTQTLHECGPGTREEKGVMFAAEITSDIKEYCQNIESSNISNYTSYTFTIFIHYTLQMEISYCYIDSVLSVLLNQQQDLNSFLAKCANSNSCWIYRESVENILMIFQKLLTTVKNDMANHLAKVMVNLDLYIF